MTKDKLLELQVQFWQKRLDHTLSHTQAATKLIYLVDGAVLALIYFLFTTFGLSRATSFIVGLIALFLSGINVLHSRFIRTQQQWYANYANRLLILLHQESVPGPTPGKITKTAFTSSHRLLSYIHVLISFLLLVVCALLLLYGIGAFPTIEINAKDSDAQSPTIIKNY